MLIDAAADREAKTAAAAAGEEDTTAAAKTSACETWTAQTRGDRLPPQLRQRFGLREEMAEQHQRRRANEQDDDRRAQQVEDDEDHGGDRAGEAEQGEEDAAAR